MLDIVLLISEQLNRHHRRFIFHKKVTRKFRDGYLVDKAVRMVNKLRGNNEPND